MRLIMLLYLILAGCAEHPDPPQPTGDLVPINWGALMVFEKGRGFVFESARKTP